MEKGQAEHLPIKSNTRAIVELGAFVRRIAERTTVSGNPDKVLCDIILEARDLIESLT